ncbi:DNA-directed RNA polymerase beta' subunit [Candidatus Sumerlaea chitinivorans]|uniref:DNA-directed RNA polymerase subunit beta' n=1 Tax=Sumerlaea chitinivorans TaxID=2250252 RepID=A0A2Z4Y7U3_SUMC1|nr:DNA-directed RNA polymerase beta' subunit [Candidatus Sumerlaea chitinivorans]
MDKKPKEKTTRSAKATRVGRRVAQQPMEKLAFEGVREVQAIDLSKYRPIPLSVETGEELPDLNAITCVARISLASPEQILAWSRRQSRAAERRIAAQSTRLSEELDLASFGEVKKPETINYRTFKPERDGLFCERIFGPTKDWECSCGKYKRIKYKGIVCDRCGVEVIESKVRRTRMGHIKLASPVCHIWFYRGSGSRIAALLDMSSKDVSKVIYLQNYVVIDPGDTPLQEKQILTDEEARKYREMYGDKVKIGIGAEAIKELLSRIDIEELATTLAIEMRKATSAQRRTKIIKRLKVVEAFRGSGNRPEWMVLDVLPVIPPDLRLLVHLDGGRFATSDLNDLYRRVINRNNRLKKLMELKAPEVILRNEKRMLQEAVDALFDNSKRTRPTKGHNGRPLKSLSDMLKGKQGRFRQNLLGKRVDYSGRSVIVVGPELRFNECGLPKKMALELFDPFIIRELERRGITNSIKTAKKMMERETPEVYDILDDIIKDHPVLLNRAPTLHRLGIQAFMPKLIEGKAIQLHPLACTAFNADFDGDQMAVHVPLSVEAKLEAKNIMLAENNILSPASGKPIATPSQDVVLGIFYLTKMVPNEERYAGVKSEEEKMARMPRFASPEECIMAFNHKVVKVHEEVIVRLPSGRKVRTTPGRVIFSQIMPPEIDYFDTESYPSFANQVLSKGQLSQIVAVAHRRVGKTRCAELLDRMKDLGFYWAKRGGISMCIDDLIIPPSKNTIIEETRKRVEAIKDQWRQGHISYGERYQRVVHEWNLAGDRIAEELLKVLEKDQNGLNPVFMMAHSGARGNESQIRQLAGMRGLMQKPTKKITGEIGEIIESPITSNFREGLTVLEYFISTHGARKGLADTALKTSDAGYLTRRLVDVAQDLIITEEDCGTHDGIYVSALKEITTTGERELEPLADRIIGRVAARDVIHPKTGEVIVRRNEEITEDAAKVIERAGIEQVMIRSVLTCATSRGICVKCYGRNLATGRMVEQGEAVGVIAAQSIGEPGTQLTLRTFHIGGMASLTVEGWYQASQSGIVRFRDLNFVETKGGRRIVINRGGMIIIESPDGVPLQRLPNVPYGARLRVVDGQEVKRGERLAEWDPHFTPILTEVSGRVRLVDILLGSTMREEIDPTTGAVSRVISEHREERHPSIQILDDKDNVVAQYALSAGTILERDLADGKKVVAGEMLARIPRAHAKSKDITGGLPRVEELFEARKPKDAAVLADISGVLHIRGSGRGGRKVTITGDNGEERLYTIPISRHLIVTDGQRVEAGDMITDGTPAPHDILAIKGEKAVMEFLLSEVQEVYRLQKVSINDKHIECIIRQMLKKVVVEEVGNTRFLYGQQVDRAEFEEENRITVEMGGTPAKARPKLLGITKASLETESFISAASFQETARVLADAAVRGRIDHLRGLKENVIMGLLIPAGTGLVKYRNIEVRPVAQAQLEVAGESSQESAGA